MADYVLLTEWVSTAPPYTTTAIETDPYGNTIFTNPDYVLLTEWVSTAPPYTTTAIETDPYGNTIFTNPDYHFLGTIYPDSELVLMITSGIILNRSAGWIAGG